MISPEEAEAARNARVIASAQAQATRRTGFGARAVGMGNAAPDAPLNVVQVDGEWVQYFLSGAVAGTDPVKNPKRRA